MLLNRLVKDIPIPTVADTVFSKTKSPDQTFHYIRFIALKPVASWGLISVPLHQSNTASFEMLQWSQWQVIDLPEV